MDYQSMTGVREAIPNAVVCDVIELSREGYLIAVLYHWMDGSRRISGTIRKENCEEFVWVHEWVSIGPDGYATYTPLGRIETNLVIKYLQGKPEGYQANWKELKPIARPYLPKETVSVESTRR